MRRAGGGSIVFVIVAVVAAYFLGIDPRQLIGALDGGALDGGVAQQTSGTRNAPAGTGSDDDGRRFVAVVLADTEDVWNRIFEANGRRYEEPTLVLFSGQARSACGFASAASGPFYCPGDRKVYIDLAFYDDLKRRFSAPGDFAQAYVIAHEIGHHVQNLTGVLPEFNRRRATMSERDANRMSVRVELQADCYAGIWAHYTRERGLLDRGDIEEALNAAHQIGDDAIQKRTRGTVVPDAFNHGTSEQRARWFRIGLDGGKVSDCTSLSAKVL